MKLNCWEVKQCGRQPQGAKIAELGICPAATEGKVNGVNGGVNGGRACWAIKNTLCGNMVQGGFSEKFVTCLSCEFYTKVRDEEGSSFTISKEILTRLN